MKEKNIHEHSPAKLLTLDQRRFDVMNQRGNNVGPTLKMKQNLTSDFQRCTAFFNVGVQR